MQKRFLIPTVDNRIDELRKMLLSMQRYKSDWIFTIVAQAYTEADKQELRDFMAQLGFNADLIFVDTGVGPARARRIALMERTADVWISLDDDMVITKETHFNKMVDIVTSRPDIGLLSINWAKTAEQVAQKGTLEKLVKQNIVYTGGGLAFRDDWAKMFLATTEDRLWLFDNVAWSLASYVAGYDNYRYLGSSSVHRACAKGGRREWVYQKSRVLPDQTLIRVRPACNNKRQMELGNCWHICDSSDLTDKAKELHKIAKKERERHAAEDKADKRAD